LSAASILGVAAFAVTVAGIIYRAARIETKIRETQIQTKKDLDGIGSKIRNDEGRAERRWKHMIATQIETSDTLEKAKQHAKLLREDAWRD
jgi:hypothetical protein